MTSRIYLSATVAAICLSPMPVAAQIATETLDTIVPVSYDRGRNVGVVERPRPEVSPIGLHAGGFTIFAMVDAQLGFSNNVYQTETNKISDEYLRLSPRLNVQSNWSRNSLQFEGSGEFIRNSSEKARDQDGWQVGARGRLDASSSVTINAGADTARLYESQFSGAAVTNVRSFTPYQRSQIRFLTDARLARVRIVGSGNYAYYDFKSVETLAGTVLNQNNRDRRLLSGSMQVEYGITPDTGVFGQMTYTDTSYRMTLSPGVANRDSSETRGLAGITMDLTAVARGSFGVGYIRRNFSSPLYQDVKGLSFEGKVEYFMSPITNISIGASRVVQDSVFVGGGFFSTRSSFRIDHELLRSLILNAGAAYTVEDYRGAGGKAKVALVGGGATYLTNRLISGKLDMTYSRRRSDFVGINGPRLSEFRLLAGISIHP